MDLSNNLLTKYPDLSSYPNIQYLSIGYNNISGEIIDNDRVMVLHFLKCRNGDTRLSFFKAEFEKMQIAEMNTPAQQEKRIGTK